MKNNLISNKRIAIIGGGPVGLTTAKLLQIQGIAVTVYERDKTPSARIGGSSLDLHKETGQKTLAKAGLLDKFLSIARPTGMWVGDMHGKTVFEMKPDKYKPEIDRHDLATIILESLEPGTVVYDRHVISLNKNGNVYELQFENGSKSEADLVIIADGTMSKARKYITETLPKETGTYVIQGEIRNPKVGCPNIQKLFKDNNLAVVQDRKTLFTHIKADGSITLHMSFRKPEKWMKENPFDFNDKKAVNSFLSKLYTGWNPLYFELFEACDEYMGFPLKVFPANEGWDKRTNVTVVGDAAHVMPPFGGMGVNMGLVDALTLTENLTDGKFTDMQSAIDDYEQKMIAYATPIQIETRLADDRIHTTIAHSFERMKKNKLQEILNIIQYVALFFLLLVTGVFWGPWLGLHRSIEMFSGAELIHLVKVMAKNLGTPMQIIMPVCLLLMSVAAWLYPQKKSRDFYFLVTSIALLTISLIISVGVELPIVNEIKTWTETTFPANWESTRNHWVIFHVIRMVAALISFGMFSAVILKPFKKINRY